MCPLLGFCKVEESCRDQLIAPQILRLKGCRLSSWWPKILNSGNSLSCLLFCCQSYRIICHLKESRRLKIMMYYHLLGAVLLFGMRGSGSRWRGRVGRFLASIRRRITDIVGGQRFGKHQQSSRVNQTYDSCVYLIFDYSI